MTDPLSIAIVGTSVLASLGVLTLAGLKGLNTWAELKRLELSRIGGVEPGRPAVGGRIEIADLRERIRKLEAIAEGIDL